MAAVGGVVLPGDAILVDRSTKKTILGPGLRQDGDLVLATKAGVVKMNETDVYWVESHQKRVSLQKCVYYRPLLKMHG